MIDRQPIVQMLSPWSSDPWYAACVFASSCLTCFDPNSQDETHARDPERMWHTHLASIFSPVISVVRDVCRSSGRGEGCVMFQMMMMMMIDNATGRASLAEAEARERIQNISAFSRVTTATTTMTRAGRFDTRSRS